MTRDQLYQAASQMADIMVSAGANQSEAVAIMNMAQQFARLETSPVTPVPTPPSPAKNAAAEKTK